MSIDIVQRPYVFGPYSTGQGSDRVVPLRKDLNNIYQTIFNIQGNGIRVDYPGGQSGKIVLTVPEDLDSPGPFFAEVEQSSTLGADDRLVIGGCLDAYESFANDDPPGRQTNTPGVLMVGNKVKLFPTIEYVLISDTIFGVVSPGNYVTKLLVLWVDSSQTPAVDYSDRGVFYDYAFIAKDDLVNYPGWTKDGKIYFPLGWITVYHNNTDASDIFKQITAVAWPNTGWILEGGSSTSVPIIKFLGLHSDSPATGSRMYIGNIYSTCFEAVSGSTPIAYSATIYIPGSSDVIVPYGGSWTTVPPVYGLRTVRTWTGASQTHTNDTVYEAVGLLLVI